jgi:hypothetical protein
MSITTKVYANTRLQVYVDPVDVLEEVTIINKGEWIIEKDGNYEIYTDFRDRDIFVSCTTKEVYELQKAKELLINYLRNLK